MGLEMVQDVPDIVEGKLVVSSYFIVGENPDAGLPLVIAGTTFVAYVSQNYTKSLQYMEDVGERQTDIVEVVQEADQNHRLISDYFMRKQVQSVLEDRTQSLTAASMPTKGAAIANDYFPGYVSTVLLAGYLWY